MPPIKPKTAHPSTKREGVASRSLYQTPNHLSYYLSKSKEVQQALQANDTRNHTSMFSAGAFDKPSKALQSEIGFSKKSEMMFSNRHSEWQTTARTPGE